MRRLIVRCSAHVRLVLGVVLAILLLLTGASLDVSSAVSRSPTPQAAASASAAAASLWPGTVVINEVMPIGDGAQAAWVELHNRAAVAISLRGATLAAGSRQVYAFPDALPDVPSGGFVLLHFSGQGSGSDDYDLSDGLASLHSAPGAVSPFQPAGDQLALRAAPSTAPARATPAPFRIFLPILFFVSDGRAPGPVADFVAWGSPPPASSAAVADYGIAAQSTIWPAHGYIPTRIGLRQSTALQPGEAIGLFPGRSGGRAASWVLYPPSRATPGRPNNADTGFAFLDGRYVEPPYAVEVVDGEIRLNGEVVRARPLRTAAHDDAPPTPQTAADLVALAAARLRELGGQPTAENRAALVGLLRTYPMAAEVSDNTSHLLVTDTAGNIAALTLLSRPQATDEEALRGQEVQAASWRTLLQQGGTLVASPGTTLEVSPQEAVAFLQSLVTAFDGPVADRAQRVEELIGVPALAASILAADLPMSLRERVPAGTVSATATGQRTAQDDLRLLDSASHQTSRTPKTATAYLFLDTWDWPSLTTDVEPVTQAARQHGYRVVQFTRNGCQPGGMTIGNFLSSSGQAAILFIGAHGASNHLSIEGHCSKTAAIAAHKAYATSGSYSPGDVWLTDDTMGDWFVAVSAQVIQSRWRDASTIVMTASCHTAPIPQGRDTSNGLADAFRAREFVGTKEEVCPADLPLASFWDRIAGTQDSGTKRNVGDAFAASDLDPSVWRHIGDGATVLSPAVASIDPPPGTLHAIGDVVSATVVFDTEVSGDPRSAVLPLPKECNPEILSARWRDRRTLEFTYRTRAAGEATFFVPAAFVTSGDNGVALDGNRDPLSLLFPLTSPDEHVGPNGDDHVWEVQCSADLPTPTPTATPTATSTPSRAGTATPTNTPTWTPTPTSTPSATATPAPRATSTRTPTPGPTNTPTATPTTFQGIHLDVSAIDDTHTTHYEVRFDDPARNAARATFDDYGWILTLPADDDCVGNSGPLVVEPGQPWRASWSHPECSHAPGEIIAVIVTEGNTSVRLQGPALGPATIRP